MAFTKPARILIYAQIHSTHGERLAFELFHNAGIHAVLLVFIGQIIAVEKQKLATEQPNAVGREAVHQAHILGRFDIGQQLDVCAVFGGGGDVF